MDSEERNEMNELLRRWERAYKGGRKDFFDTDEYLRLSDYYMQQERINDAQDVLSAGLHASPTSAELLLQKARIVLYKGKKKEALNMLTSVEKRISSWDEEMREEVLMLKGQIYVQMNKVWEAELIFNEQLRIRDFNLRDAEDIAERVRQLESISRVYQEADMYSRSLEYLDLALHLLEHFRMAVEMNEELWMGRDDLRRQKIYLLSSMRGEEHTQQAIDLCNKMIDEQPYDVELWHLIGQNYMVQGNYAKAVEAYKNVAAIDPAHDYAILQVAKADYQLEDYADAIKMLDKLLNWKNREYMEGNYIAFLQMKGACQEALGKDSAAVHTYIEGVNEWDKQYGAKDAKGMVDGEKVIPPTDRSMLVDMLMAIGGIGQRHEEHDLALACFRRAALESPSNTYVMNCLAEECLIVDDKRNARKIYHEVIAQEPDNLIALVGMAKVENQMGHCNKSIAYLHHAERIFNEIKTSETKTDYWINLLFAVNYYQISTKRILGKKKNLAEAIRRLKIASSYDTKMVNVFFQMCPDAKEDFEHYED